MMALVREIAGCDISMHGFRSTFRVWAAEQTNIPREIAEMALAHKTQTDTEDAYQRSKHSKSAASSWTPMRATAPHHPFYLR